jgi:hypothetical protein
VDWGAIDPERLFGAIRERGPAPDAERAVWAFEQALGVARIDGELLSHLLVACVCLLAYGEDESPRTLLEQAFRRSVSDDEWRERFAPLLA